MEGGFFYNLRGTPNLGDLLILGAGYEVVARIPTEHISKMCCRDNWEVLSTGSPEG